MHYEWITILPVVFAFGCASAPPKVRYAPASPPVAAQQPPAFPATLPVKWVETRYTVRGYREAVTPDIRHEAHVVFRRTRVSLSSTDDLETVPRNTYEFSSIAPLSASDDLAAELRTQKEITRELRDVKTSMVGMETQMQARYAVLVKQSAEVAALRGQLEAENARLHALKQTQVNAPAVAPPVADNSEVRW